MYKGYILHAELFRFRFIYFVTKTLLEKIYYIIKIHKYNVTAGDWK